ncbi:hypothetical protein [Tsukamurella soli]|uniref:DUF222 domain-containing protein n=1 Tax=Tsukamurella soli TaxID=644556 RepID=A0ABP8JJ51_9ACTN
MSDLDSRITQFAAANPGLDPGRITDQILRRATPQERQAWLMQLMGRHVAEVLRGDELVEVPLPAVTPQPRSKKREGIRDHFQAALDQRLSIGGTMRRLGELTLDDLAEAAAARRNKSRTLLDQADHFDILAKAVADEGVETVEDLPRTTLASVLDIHEPGAEVQA